MIVGVPDHHTLHETATGWMNLAWGIAIKEAEDFQETEFLYDGIASEHGNNIAQKAIAKHWQAKQLLLKNALSLLQQSLEIFLKTRIAEVSPYLLIVGAPSTWPSPDATGCVDFSNFRTLDAVQLCRVVNIASRAPLSDQFVQFYDRLRQSRNKIIHLDAASIKIELKTIIVDILTAQKFMFPDTRWNTFRNQYLISTEEYHDKENLFTGEDYTTNVMIAETRAVINELEADDLKKFLYFDKGRPSYRCPYCLAKREGIDDECEFAQLTANTTMRCVVCLSSYSIDEYKEEIIKYFGYLDEKDQMHIKEELEADFS